jgi:hypothetical protein
VVARERHQAKTHPLEVLDELRVAPHVGADALVRRRVLVIVEEHLAMDVRRVGAADELDELEEIGLRVHAEPLADQRFAGDRDIDVVALGAIHGAFVVVLSVQGAPLAHVAGRPWTASWNETVFSTC